MPKAAGKNIKWTTVTDPTILGGLPAEVEDAEHNKYSTVGVKQYPRPGFATIFLLAAGVYYYCSLCGCVQYFGDSIGNVNRHISSDEHQQMLAGTTTLGGDLDDRIFGILAEIAFNMRPFRLVESVWLAPIINTPYPVTGATARKIIVATGMCVQRVIQGFVADAALGALVHQPRIVAAYIQIDGWSRRMGSRKMAGVILRVLYADGRVREWVVALQPYAHSREDARALAEMIHRIAELYGVTPFLKVVTTDSPGVTIAASKFYNKRRRAQWFPSSTSSA
jgi:hypothetical protein